MTEFEPLDLPEAWKPGSKRNGKDRRKGMRFDLYDRGGKWLIVGEVTPRDFFGVRTIVVYAEHPKFGKWFLKTKYTFKNYEQAREVCYELMDITAIQVKNELANPWYKNELELYGEG